jgi:pectate lyase
MTARVFFPPATKVVSAFGKVVIGLSVLLALLVPSARALSTLPFYESFPTNYAEGSALTVSPAATVWDSGNGAGAGAVTVASAAALSSSGLVTSNGSRGLVLTGTPSSNRDRGASFTSQTLGAGNPVVYVSFLFNVQVPATTNRLVGYLRSDTSQGTPHAGIFLDESNQLSVSKNSLTPAAANTSALNNNQTYLVVLRYKWISAVGGDDEVALWLNPGSLGVAEGLVPTPTISTTSGSDLATMASFMIGNRSAAGDGTASGTQWMDEVRVATNWAGVTPSNGTNPPISTSAPVITLARLALQGMVLRGTNGTPTGNYQVITSTNLTQPMTNWPAVGNYSFDGIGNFDSTNPVTAGMARQFFRLLVGATNPPASTAPGITNQPQSLTVAVGANANFSVGASGTATLNYFWSFNTNTPVGGNSSTLALVNVATNDAGSYRVVVSNSVGTATSSVATLTVLIPPSITTQPTNFTVTASGSAAFTVTAAGSATLRYQWFFNTNTALVNATNATFSLNPVNATNGGTYSVIVTNAVGSVTSSFVVLTVVGPPVITAQPQSQSVTVSNDAPFTVTAAGTAPLAYQWLFNTNTLVGGNSNSYTRINAQATNAGTYSVIITNNYGAVTSAFATLTVNTAAVDNTIFNLAGFAWTTTGGGIIAESSAAYRKVTNALDLANAIDTASIKVIEITTNLDLGYLEIGAAAQAVGPFRNHAIPSLHPRLIQTGVSLLDIQSRDGLTIFSTNGATIKHCCFNIKNARNIIVRNLKFDEMWEWDEATKGNYDSKDWDFIDLGNGGGTGTTTNIWIDHCTFTKTYDGIVDIKGGANHVTLSWNKYVGDDGASNTNSFVWQQINTLESNKTAYAMYNSLRTASGFTPAEIVSIIQGQDKTHLAGANDGVANAGNAAENALISITFHHQWFQNCWDRCVPRLRAGNVHDFNIYADDSLALDAKRLRDAHGVNSSYSFNPVLNGSIATESGAILVENSIYQDCLTPLRNNQTDVSNAAYTGKIMALNSIYSFRTTGGTTNTYTGSSTNAPGDTYFGPVQAPVIAFSWNLPGNVLPYSYTMTDPNQLKSVLTNATTGCGAGVLTWAKTNWMKTAY